MYMRKGNDLGRQTAEFLCQVHESFEAADEAFRRFRTMLMEPAEQVRCNWFFAMPLEWIPISEN